jgi:hypothetical protein
MEIRADACKDTLRKWRTIRKWGGRCGNGIQALGKSGTMRRMRTVRSMQSEHAAGATCGLRSAADGSSRRLPAAATVRSK